MASRFPELKAVKGYGDHHASWSIHHREALNAEAGLANEIIKKWAMVAAVPDGEDSAGRQQLRLPSAQELAERACDIAAAAQGEFEKRGWVFEIPSSEVADAEIAERDKKEKRNDI